MALSHVKTLLTCKGLKTLQHLAEYGLCDALQQVYIGIHYTKYLRAFSLYQSNSTGYCPFKHAVQ